MEEYIERKIKKLFKHGDHDKDNGYLELFGNKYINNGYSTNVVKKHSLFNEGDFNEREFEKMYELVFHGTGSMTSLNSILTNGFLLPGDFNPYTGQSLRMANGALYGDGIYTTTDIDLSAWFSFVDMNLDLVFIVSILKKEIVFDYPEEERDMTKMREREKNLKKFYIERRGSKFEVNYGSNKMVDTIRVNSRQIFVSANSDLVVPIGTLSLKNMSGDKKLIYMDKGNNSIVPVTYEDYERSLPKEGRSVPVFHFYNDLYIVIPKMKKCPKVKDEENGIEEIKKINRGEGAKKESKENTLISKTILLKEIKHVMQVVINQSVFLQNKYLDILKSFDAFLSTKIITSKVRLLITDDKGNLIKTVDILNSESFMSIKLLKATKTSDDEVLVLTQALNYVAEHNLNTHSIIILKLSDDNDFQIENVTEKMYALFKKKYSLVVKLLFACSPSLDLLSFKSAFSIPSSVEEFFQVIGLENKSLFNCLDQIGAEMINHNLEWNDDSNPYSISENNTFKIVYGRVGEGFIERFGDTKPSWDLTTNKEAVIVKGFPICVNINGLSYAPEFTVASPETVVIIMDYIKSSLSSLRSLAFSRELNILAMERDSNHNISLSITALLHKVRLEMKNTDNKEVMNSLLSTLSIARRILGDVTTFSSLKNIAPKWLVNLHSLKFGRRIAKRLLKNRNSKNLEDEKEKNKKIVDVESEILQSKLKGLGVRIKSSPASEIDPWIVIVEYVSNEMFEISKIYKMGLFNIVIRDNRKKQISDALLLFPDRLLSYNAFIFTRNPAAVIPNQHLALLSVTIVSLIEKMFRQKGIDRNELMENFKQVNTLVESLRGSRKKALEDIASGSVTNSYELKDYHSLCQLFSQLISGELPRDKIDPFDLLVDSICRECHIYMKTSTDSVEVVIDKLFEGVELDNLNGFLASKEVLIKRTGLFYFQGRKTNCSPFAVVSLFAFLDDPSTFVERILQKKVTMLNFLKKERSSFTPGATQTALYIFGMKHHSGRMKNEKFTDPTAVINEATEEVIKYRKIKSSNLEAKENRVQKRYEKRVDNALPFMTYHGIPKMFNHGEIKLLNESRPRDNQLELLNDSGLLKYHCCYETCPDYLGKKMDLKSMRTNDLVSEEIKKKEEVKKKGDEDPKETIMVSKGAIRMKKDPERIALMNHLNSDHILHNYVPHFHVTGKHLALNSVKYEEFELKMNEHFKKDERYANLRNLQENLLHVWNMYGNRKK